LYYHPKEISSIHGQFPNIDITTNKKEFKTIAVSVDFSTSDNKALNYALQLSNSDTELILIHIIDNVGSIVYQHQDESVELKSDTKFIERYCEMLSQKGVKCRYILGFGSPKKELPKIVHQINADILIMGAHGHKTIKDILLGTTIDEVRHSIKIPLLVV
jgi:manganese transport protein